MEQVLIVSSAPKEGQEAARLLQGQGYERLLLISGGNQARRKLAEADFGLVLVCPPLADENPFTFAVSVAETYDAGVLLLTEWETEETLAADMAGSGVFVVPKAYGDQFFLQALRLAQAYGRRWHNLKQENRLLQQKIQDIRLINRAKLVLIQYLGMTETQAHRYIEKQAMDLRQPRQKVAKDILRTYEKE